MNKKQQQKQENNAQQQVQGLKVKTSIKAGPTTSDPRDWPWDQNHNETQL